MAQCMVEVSLRRPLPLHGSDHDSKPLPGIHLSARPLHSGQEDDRELDEAAQGSGRDLLARPSTGAGYDQLAPSKVVRRMELAPGSSASSIQGT